MRVRLLLLLLLMIAAVSPRAIAQQKLTDLSATTSAAPTDIVYVVLTPGGTPASRKMTVDNFFLARTGNKNLTAYASLSAAVTAIGSAQATIEIGATTTVSATLTVPSNITLLLTGAGLISVSSGQTLTINGPIQAPNREIFTGSGTVVVNKQAVVPHWYGALVDGRVVTDGAMTASGTTLTSATAAFTAAMVGWLIDIEGSGTSAADIHGVTGRHNQVGTITAYISATQVTVSFTAVATVSGKQVVFGPDDASPMAKAFASGKHIYFPAGTYVHSTGITLGSGRTISGDGQGVSILRNIGPYRNITTGINLFTIPDGVRDVTFENLSMLGTNVNAAFMSTIQGTSFAIRVSTGATGAIRNILIRDCEIGYIWGQACRSNGDSGDQAGLGLDSSLSTIINVRVLDCNMHHCSDDIVNFNNSVLIARCRLTDSWAGIEAAGSRVQILDNYIGRNYSGGASFASLGNPSLGKDFIVTGNLIERNGISGNGGYGLQIGGNTVHCIVANNIIKENSYQGIGISDGNPDFANLSRNIVVSHNQIVSNGMPASGPGFGIVITGNAAASAMSAITIESNEIFDDGVSGYAQNQGITVYGDGVKLLRNFAHGNLGYDYVIASATNVLLVRDDSTSTLQQYGPNGYTGTVDTATTTAAYKTGTLFSTKWVGVPITINSIPYLISAVAAEPTGNFTASGLTITRTSGPNFDAAWIGKYIRLGPSYYFYVSAVGGASTMTITNALGITVPASGAWTLYGSVSMTLATSAGTQSGVTYSIPPHAVYLPDNSVLQAVAFVAAPVFDANQGNAIAITLTGNVTSSTLANGVNGQVVTFMISQDATGSRTFAFPSNVFGATAIGSTASKVNVQSFRKSGSNWYAIAAGVTNQG